MNVVIKGQTTTGTITDYEGEYSLEVDSSDAILLFSFVGYLPQEIPVDMRSEINVAMTADPKQLGEVVVVAYGTQKKENLTGSIQVINSKDLENRPASNATSLLQGNANGILFNSPSSGFAPGQQQTIAIRGGASLNSATPPLVVIDGIPTDMSDFNTLNPDDIESITVLKDAAASAVYGARAPYGVLIVTLKKGKRNQKPTFTYSGNYSVVTPVNYPDPTDAYTFALARNESYRNSQAPIRFNATELEVIKGNVENPGKYTLEELVPVQKDGTYSWGDVGRCNTNWFKVWLKNSERQSHDLSLRGGTDKTNYFFSTGYLYQPGIFNYVSEFDNYKRFTLNGGFNNDINKWIKLGFRTRYSLARFTSPTLGGAGIGLLYGWVYGGWPNVPLKNPNGEYNQSSRVNPAIQGGKSMDDQNKLDNVLELNLNPIKGLDIHVDGTWRLWFQDHQSLNNPVIERFYADNTTIVSGTSSIRKNTRAMNYWTTQVFTSYTTTFDKHFAKLQLGMQAEEANNRSLSGNGTKLLAADTYAINIATQGKTASDGLSTWATTGFFYRLNYNFDERFLLELNGRYDGTARYAKDKRWGFFPSASAGWNISQEKFWESLKTTVNFAKVRVAYGTLGDQGNIPNFLYIPTLEISPNTSWVFGGQTSPYVNTPGILNPDVTWNKITTLDVGSELKFLTNRLSLEFAWFKRRSWDILGPPSPVPSVLGTSAPLMNNAEFVTKGFELQLDWQDKISAKMEYGVRVYLSDAQSTITKYNAAKNYVDQWYSGMKWGEIWGYQADRLLTAEDFNADGKLKVNQDRFSTIWYPGDVKYEKISSQESNKISTGDGTVENPGDRKIIGNSTPRYSFSTRLSFAYSFANAGKVDCSIFLQGVAKRDQVGDYSMYYWGAGSETGNDSDVNIYKGGKQLDFYRDENAPPELLAKFGLNQNSYFPRPYIGSKGWKNFQPNTRYLISQAYMRIKNVQVAYTMPPDWLKKVGLRSCRMYFSGENLFTFQSASLPYWIDPEMPRSNSYSSWMGRNYLQQATYSFGINLGF